MPGTVLKERIATAAKKAAAASSENFTIPTASTTQPRAMIASAIASRAEPITYSDIKRSRIIAALAAEAAPCMSRPGESETGSLSTETVENRVEKGGARAGDQRSRASRKGYGQKIGRISEGRRVRNIRSRMPA